MSNELNVDIIDSVNNVKIILFLKSLSILNYYYYFFNKSKIIIDSDVFITSLTTESAISATSFIMRGIFF